MSTINDYIGLYDKTIHQYADVVNMQAVEESVNTVVDFIREFDCNPSELLDFHNKDKLLGQEIYKSDIYEQANKALSLDTWSPLDIGSGSISKHVADAMSLADNLVNRRYAVPQFLDKLKTPDKQKRDAAERALYEIYCGDDEKEAFTDAIKVFGAKYSVLAYLFFIKDRDRFLPTSPEAFDAIFEKIGLSFRMSNKCSWNNYCEYIAIISRVNEYLSQSGLCNHEVSLLDAHSLVWVMNYKEFKVRCGYIDDINISLRPKNTITATDGTIKYQCPRCDVMFKQARRCPVCGQSVKAKGIK